MCGLVGVFGDIGNSHKEAFRILSILDILRGDDGYGVCRVTAEGEVTVEKEVGTPFDLYDQHYFESKKGFFEPNGTIKGNHIRLLLGHNRAATVGKVSKETAHPFEFEHIVGAHNGTLLDSSLRSFSKYGEYTVDSQVMLAEINEKGEVPSVYSRVNGAMAVTLWDKRTSRLVMFRNNDRPLSIVTSNTGKTIMWASEDWMLEVALARVKQREAFGKPEKVNVNTLLEFEYHSFQKGVELVTETKLTSFFYQSQGSYYRFGNRGGYDAMWDQWDDLVDKKREKEEKTPQGQRTWTPPLSSSLPDLTKAPWKYDANLKRYLNPDHPNVQRLEVKGLVFSKTGPGWYPPLPLAQEEQKPGNLTTNFPQEAVKHILPESDWIPLYWDTANNEWAFPDGTSIKNLPIAKYLAFKNARTYLPILPRHTDIKDGPDGHIAYYALTKKWLPCPALGGAKREAFIIDNSRQFFWAGHALEQSVWRGELISGEGGQEYFLPIKPDFNDLELPGELDRITKQMERDNVHHLPTPTVGRITYNVGPYKGETMTVHQISDKMVKAGLCDFCAVRPTTQAAIIGALWLTKDKYICGTCVPYATKVATSTVN